MLSFIPNVFRCYDGKLSFCVNELLLQQASKTKTVFLRSVLKEIVLCNFFSQISSLFSVIEWDVEFRNRHIKCYNLRSHVEVRELYWRNSSHS